MTRFGIQAGQGDMSYEVMRNLFTEIERLGYDSIWLYDHFYSLASYPKITQGECLEPYTLLAAMAPLTRRIRLGTLVTCVPYRHPPVLAKIASAMDVMSNGRFELALGAGWYEPEFAAYGIPFEKPSVRIARLEEAVQIIKKMFTEDEATFEGKYYTIRNAINSPKPIQKPHPPILIGASGEKLAIKVVAKYADKYCGFFTGKVEADKRKFSVLREHCEAVGRDYDDIVKTSSPNVFIAPDSQALEEAILAESSARGLPPEEYQKRLAICGTPSQCSEQLQGFVELGVEEFMFVFPKVNKLQHIRLFAEEVIPRFK